MKNSQKLLEQAKIVPKLRLGTKTDSGVTPNGAHRVKMISDRVYKAVDNRTGKEIEFVEYTLEEGGQQKTYTTKMRGKDGNPSYLVQRFAEIGEGEEVILEMKKSGIKNYIEVIPVSGSSNVEIEDGSGDEEEVVDISDDSDELPDPNSIPF